MKTKRNRGQELLNSCYFGNKNMALKLLREGVTPNYTDPHDGWAGIHYAARWGQTSVVRVLIASRVDVNILTRERETPLHIACNANRREVCIWLMKNGANPRALDQSQQQPADLTADKEIKFICEHFEEYKKIMAEKQKTQK